METLVIDETYLIPAGNGFMVDAKIRKPHSEEEFYVLLTAALDQLRREAKEALNRQIFGLSSGLNPFRVGKPEMLRRAIRAEWLTETLAHFGYLTMDELRVVHELEKPGFLLADAVTSAIEMGFGSAKDGFRLPNGHPMKERS